MSCCDSQKNEHFLKQAAFCLSLVIVKTGLF
jgi:hypothetical protein